ncbi:major facilitator superfamily transporter [Niveomyces insectorum RCEF 264]|uniref:Major facilitator superfamily transporter n=1 Tax=Niveomyces insectorum RCEF 264 TaxID=1081102 RepID=A0A167Z5H0_9HYPO|nr:major facilitator superfamily transporter [Niveomyces insectorum RCEF 264]
MATVLTEKKLAFATVEPISDSEGSLSTSVAADAVSAAAHPLPGSVPPLGLPVREKQFWWQRRRRGADGSSDLDAIATQPSVFDDPDTAASFQPPPRWENTHRFDPLFRWTWREERQLVRKIDLRIMVWACLMFMALELDRSNLVQAVSDNFLGDLKMTTNDYNLGNSVFKLSFMCAEVPSQLVSKWLGPDRWIPLQMVLWSIVAIGQFWLNGRSAFLATRALLGILQGGFIPDIILYLSYFYKHFELSIRLSFFWMAMSFADILSALLAYGLLHMRGVEGRAGWRWLFLLEGLLTGLFGLLAAVLMPAGPCQTASWFRGRKGWFSEREEKIIVNRVLREDPTKSTMHNRQPITPRTLWQSLCDFDLWPLYLIGLTFQIPVTPQTQYITLSLKGQGFNTFQTNLLTIPYTVLHIGTMLALTYVSEIWNELTLTSMIGQIWALPFLVWFYITDTTATNRWLVFAMTTMLLAYPSAHPIQVNWNSRNSNAVRLRTVSAACYNMMVQAGAVIASNIYRADDAPRYKRGNKQLLAIACMNIGLYLLTKVYYQWRNKRRAARWDAMTEDERLTYLATTKDAGNKRLDFRFAN